MIDLIETSKKDSRLVERMENHYSKPKGFVGRCICYAIHSNGKYYGHIVGGSATLHLPGRNDFLQCSLNNVVNNIFYSCSGPYPMRNFTSAVVKEFCSCISYDWQIKYGDLVLGFESLVELPRTGELYKRAGWSLVGETLGQTCKRTAGNGSDSWGGQRVWNRVDLKPKLVFCFKPKQLVPELSLDVIKAYLQ